MASKETMVAWTGRDKITVYHGEARIDIDLSQYPDGIVTAVVNE